MIHYWKLKCTDHGKPLHLYTATSKEAIQRDQQGGTSHSLMTIVRMSRLPESEFSEDQDHRDLAGGAFNQAVRRPGIVPEPTFEEVREIPMGLTQTGYGGYYESPQHMVVAINVYWEWPEGKP